MKRQKVRRLLIFLSFMLFPITMWYFSPYLIIQAVAQHILNGSFWVFTAMLVLSTFCGRAFCGYLCPAGGLQECCRPINGNPAKQGWRDKIKYGIWGIWIIGVIITYLLGKNKVRIDFFYMTDHGISVAEIFNYVIYYGVLLILFLPSVFHGRRAACHYICWMAPFMIIGSWIGRKLHLPQLHVEAVSEKCSACGRCNKACPMGLDVRQMVEKEENAECTECIQCGECIEGCPNKVLRYAFKWK